MALHGNIANQWHCLSIAAPGISSNEWRRLLSHVSRTEYLEDLVAWLLRLSIEDGLCRRAPLEHTGLSLATAPAAAGALAPAVARHRHHERGQLLLCQAQAHLIAVRACQEWCCERCRH